MQIGTSTSWVSPPATAGRLTTQQVPGTTAAVLTGSSATGRSNQTGTPSARDVASLAQALNISTSALNTHLTKGGLLSFTAGPSGAVSLASSSGGLRGLPLTEWGIPDFDAIKAAGGTVTGTMPPNGSTGLIDLATGTAYYSAQIEFPDGRSQYVRGMAHKSDGSEGVSANFKNLSDALGFLGGLPGSMAEARSRIGEYNSGLRSTIDFAM